MRLLILTYEFPPLPGGIGRYCATLAKGLIGLGHEVLVFIPRQINGAESAVPGAEVRCVPRYQGPLRHFIDAYRLYQVAQFYDPDYVLATHSFSFTPVGSLSFVYNLRYALAIIGSDVQHYAAAKGATGVLRRFLFQRALRQAKALICISRYSGELLRAVLPIPPNKLCTVYMGLDEQRFIQSDEERVKFLREKLGLEGKTILLTVARLVPRKGYDQMLKALRRIVSTYPDIHYLIVGRGPDEARLRRMVRNLELVPNVTFAGYVPEEELNNYYDLADIYVMPSRQEGEEVEGFGLAFIEASARGVPVIGGRHGGVPEAILDGQTGYLVDPLNPDEIAKRVVELIEDPSLRQKLGEQGRKRVLEYFTARRMAQETIAVFMGDRGLRS